MKIHFFIISAFLSSLPFTCAAEQTLLQYLPLPPGSSAQAIKVDSSGNILAVASVIEPSGRNEIRVIKIDPLGNTLGSIDFGGTGSNGIGGLALDSSGNAVVVGSTNSTDFPLTSPLISSTTPAQSAGFVVKIDSGLTTIIFSTLLGGTEGGGTKANAVAVDSTGNIYVTGSTGDTNFPVTSGAFQNSPPPSSPGTAPTYAFLSEISSDGQKIVFSTYFGNSGVTCTGSGSSCAFPYASTIATGIALDAANTITIAGNTTANNLPTTAGAYDMQCGCSYGVFTGFLARFSSDGSNLLWATYSPSLAYTASDQTSFSGQVLGLALDSAGNVVIVGLAYGGLPTTPGALQTSVPGQLGASSGFVAELDSSGQNLLFATYFGGNGAAISAVTIDSQGFIWITGLSNPQQLPAAAGTPLLGNTFVAALSSDGSSIAEIVTAPQAAAGQAIVLGLSSAVLSLGTASSILITTPAQGPSLVGMANSAASQVSNVVVPYELISLYGAGIGPATAATGQVVNGVLTNSLSGVQVLFDGTPAPLLYVGPTQINAIVPSAVTGQNTTTLQIVTPSGTIQGPALLIRPSAPDVFVNFNSIVAGFPSAAALNQDGSVNSASNPATQGSIVTVWATGAGQPAIPWPDGTILNQRQGGVDNFVSVLWSDESLRVLYAGDAPDMVAGVIQVNFQLPVVPGDPVFQDISVFQLQVGDAVSQSFSVYAK